MTDRLYALLVVGAANGHPTEYDGQYVQTFDPDYEDGLGRVWTTRYLSEARVFSTVAEALEFWRTQSTVKPLRADGKPNRPLTALTVETVPVEVTPP